MYLYVNWNNPRKGRNAWYKSQVKITFVLHQSPVDSHIGGFSLSHYLYSVYSTIYLPLKPSTELGSQEILRDSGLGSL